MVNREQQRGRYLGGEEGAPPLPPPGGYRGARRVQPSGPLTPPPANLATSEPGAAATVPTEETKPAANALGWIALSAAAAFVLILLIVFWARNTGAFFEATLLTLQLVLAGLIVAALVTERGRRLGAIALSIALLGNIATIGAMSAVRTAETGDYESVKSEQQRHDEAFPGIKGTHSRDTLDQPSLEMVRARAEAFMADVRRALTARYEYLWVEAEGETLRPERNGYGGESMLVRFYSTSWATAQPVNDYPRKVGIMNVIAEVARDHDMWGPYSLNDESSFDAGIREKLYGSADPRTQHTWEWYALAEPDPGWLYIVVFDLSQDRTGDLRAAREAQRSRTGEPLEGLQLVYYAPALLSEADRAEFIERMREYPGR